MNDFGIAGCTECSDSREKFESNFDVSECLTEKVHLHYEPRWFRLQSQAYMKNSEIYESITGKFLFFQPNPIELLQIAVNELQNHGFHSAKISEHAWSEDKNTGKMCFVLCLYDADKSRTRELTRRVPETYGKMFNHGFHPVRWKTDADTLNGVFSKSFLESMKER